MKEQTYLISVIVPAYNIEKYLPRCLDSIRNQTWSNLEILVIDDGSRDRTGEIADAYAAIDDRIRVIHTENGGVSSARNRGILEAAGTYIGFVDGDDEIEPDMYEFLIQNAIEYDADISHCGYKMVFPSKEVSYFGTGEIKVQTGQEALRDLLRGYPIEPGLWNKLYKQEMTKTHKLSNGLKINEDLLFNFYMFDEAKRSVFEDKTKYHYMLRENSAATSSINKKKMEDPVTVWNEILEIVKDRPDLQKLAEARMLHVLTENVLLSPKTLDADARSYQQECRRTLASMRAALVPAAGKATRIKSYGAVHFPQLMRGMLWCVRAVKGNLHPYEVK